MVTSDINKNAPTTTDLPVEFFSDFGTLNNEENDSVSTEIEGRISVVEHQIPLFLKQVNQSITQDQIDILIKAYINYSDDILEEEEFAKPMLKAYVDGNLSDFVITKMPEMATEILNNF